MKLVKSGYGDVEHVVIFDKAQCSWTYKRLADYLKRDGVPNLLFGSAGRLTNDRISGRWQPGDQHWRSRHFREDQGSQR